MPLRIFCRSCGETFATTSAGIGQTCTCPVCGAENAVPRTSAIVGEFSDEECRELAVVRRGLGVILLAPVLGGVFLLTLLIGEQVASLVELPVMRWLLVLVYAACPVAVAVGQYLCLSVPVLGDSS